MLSYQRVLLVQDGAPSRAKAFRNALQVAEVYGKNGRYNERVHSSLIVKTNHPEHGDESQKTWEKSEKSQKNWHLWLWWWFHSKNVKTSSSYEMLGDVTRELHGDDPVFCSIDLTCVSLLNNSIYPGNNIKIHPRLYDCMVCVTWQF